ncbi:iron deficiency-induced protein A [Candidatus Thiomargarita nelsonii]|uniref:Iron deficiency-induced protein A n=1 Tax=Candidatus Thiomargarita nelsonii TaxID=1003181 RepID=A0A4E0QM54_9GAMM|nr:iron deficiency-induced protein A [Candidatus Thiomargarita nelsonii]
MYKSTLLKVSVLLIATSIIQVAASEVNLYSARKEALIKPLLDKFTQETGIRVNLVTGKADALLKRLQSEGRNSPADLLITVDAGRLYRAKKAGVLQAVSSKLLTKAIKPQYRDPEGYWYGLSLRARVVMYVKDQVKPAQLETIEALADKQWRGQICIRSSSNIYNQSLVASMIAAKGVEKTEAWVKGLVANFARPPAGGDRDQIKAAAAGQCSIAIANTYYLGKMLSGKSRAQRAAATKMAIFWPNQQDRGVHINLSGAGITKASKNRENAIKLLEYLLSAEAQKWYAQANFEYPVKSGVEISALLKSWGDFKADTLNLSQLGALNPAAMKLMDRAGWK